MTATPNGLAANTQEEKFTMNINSQLVWAPAERPDPTVTALTTPCVPGAACIDSGSTVLTFDVVAGPPGAGVAPVVGAPIAGAPIVGVAPVTGSLSTTGGGTTIGGLALVLILVGYSLRRIARRV